LDGDHHLQAEQELYNLERFNPFWIVSPTLDHIKKLLFATHFPEWFVTTMIVSVASTFLSLFPA
jgi:multiple sugar transport system permease protein